MRSATCTHATIPVLLKDVMLAPLAIHVQVAQTRQPPLLTVLILGALASTIALPPFSPAPAVPTPATPESPSLTAIPSASRVTSTESPLMETLLRAWSATLMMIAPLLVPLALIMCAHLLLVSNSWAVLGNPHQDYFKHCLLITCMVRHQS